MILRHAFIPSDNARLSHLCGPMDENLRAIEASLGVTISRRNESFTVEGAKKDAEAAVVLMQSLYDRARKAIPAEFFQLALARAADGRSPGAIDADVADAGDDVVLSTRHAHLKGRTANQQTYLRNILSHDLTFGIGPAGTGKTFLAVACAVDALERSSVQRIILTRPAVEAGERLGFLPGDLSQKVDPYLRPLYDALYDCLPAEQVERRIASGEIEVAPIAFMRGRTLADAFVILDEAQNTTPAQMKMFLTRFGQNSRMVICGDPNQTDLPGGVGASGLADATVRLEGVEGISMTRFTTADVVRHPIVGRIVEAYEGTNA